jgi:hypothetical protein
MKKKAEETRIRYLYRYLVLKGIIKLPYKAALKFVGPDCAYHLYSVSGRNGRGGMKRKARKGRPT